MLAILTAAVLVAMTGPAGGQTLPRPPYPVVFVHGLASDAGTWLPASQFLTQGSWVYGGAPTFIAATSSVTAVSAGDFYTLNFSDYASGVSHSQNLSLSRQGYELAAIIGAVLEANPGTDKVILVAHSMGGLAAREYLQGLARADGAAPAIVYRNDVAQLIGIGTPHLGSPLASLCPFLPAACQAVSIDPGSVAVAELMPGSPSLVALNNQAAHPLPSVVRYDSIAGLGGIPDGDGVVPRASQEYLSMVPGLDHRLVELAIPQRGDCGASIAAGNTVVFAEVHTCETGDPAVLNTALDAVLEPRLTVLLNKQVIAVGDTLTLTLDAQPGVPDHENIGDLYVGAVVPDGSIYLLTPSGFALAFDGNAVVPGGLQPFRANTVLASGAEALFSAPITAPIPAGQYAFVAVLVEPGTTPADAANWLSNLALGPFSVPAPGY